MERFERFSILITEHYKLQIKIQWYIVFYNYYTVAI